MNRHTGQHMGLREHIAQSVADIIATPIGSRVMRRDYGSLVPELLDHPNNELTRLRVYSAAASALAKWEPRLRVSSLQLAQDTTPGRTVLTLQGSWINGDAEGPISLSLPMPYGATA
jgi:phage baseplate assembly protein W